MTKNPRVRNNLNQLFSHNVGYAGGKILRKRMTRLAQRQAGCEQSRENLRKRLNKTLPESAYTMPGSMK